MGLGLGLGLGWPPSLARRRVGLERAHLRSEQRLARRVRARLCARLLLRARLEQPRLSTLAAGARGRGAPAAALEDRGEEAGPPLLAYLR